MKTNYTKKCAVYGGRIPYLLYTEARMRRVHNHKNILPSTHSPVVTDTSLPNELRTQKTYAEHRFAKKVAFVAYELLPTISILVIPLCIHFGFSELLSNFLTQEVKAQVTLDIVSHSPLNTPLLSAVKSADAQKAIGGGDLFYEDGVLVSTGPIGEDEVNKAKAENGEISVYVVREGDALSQIASMYGVTTNTILWANSLTKATDIHEGQSLVILPIVGVRHTVLKDQTLGSIVKKYEANLQEVLDYNNLVSSEDIAAGDELIIPGGELHTAKPVVAKATPTKTTGAKGGGSSLINPAPGSLKTQGIHGYNGVDLASKGGVYIPIRAAQAGTVLVSKSSGWNGGYGNYIVIKHSNGTQTLYSHLSSNAVAVGDVVEQGENIGVMGNTGKSTGTHLHFEVRGGTNPF